MATKKFSDRFNHTLRSYTLAQARAIALIGSGFGATESVDNPPLKALRHLGLLQIDTVNVFARAHTMPAFSRFGAYPVSQLNELMSSDDPAAIEYWAHEACVIPTGDYQLMGWRREEYVAETDDDSKFWSHHPDLVRWIFREISTRGPLTVAELEHEANRTRGGWWGWSDVKRLTVIAFLRGDLVAWGRSGTTRVFDLAENHPELFATDLTAPEQMKELLFRASRVLGLAREEDLADYYRMKRTRVRPLLKDLVAEGRLMTGMVGETPVFVAPELADLHASDSVDAIGRQASTPLLLSPFDPLVWYRPRVEWLWDFHYRIEIYTPEPKRQFGYYSLPILHRGMLAGRIDLKADRRAKRLIVKAAWHELDSFGKSPRQTDLDRLAKGLIKTLNEAARWQGCESVEIQERGNLADRLKGSADFL